MIWMSEFEHLFHAFTRLEMTVSESSFEGVRTDHRFELTSTVDGAEVWRSSELVAPGGTCSSEPRFIGWLTSRQVVELLVEIERSGVYEALPAAGIVPGQVDPDAAPTVSMRVCSDTMEHEVLDHVPTDAIGVIDVVRVVRSAVELAQERALTASG